MTVSFPVTAGGHVGMILIVDLKSKFVYGAPLRNKSRKNVARVAQDVVDYMDSKAATHVE